MKVLTKKDVDEASKILLEDGVIAFPTETVYGLGVTFDKYDNYLKLVKVKNRPNDKPFTIMCSDIKQVRDLIIINELANKIINKFMPGAITLILKAKPGVKNYLDLNTGFIGIRIPNDEFVLKLINMVKKPLLVPSANPSNLKPATNYLEVINYFDGKIDAVIKGNIKSNIPSTIIKIDGDNIILIREGEISLEKIKKEIGLL